jgi:metal-responsive CopG/Arc/MetJ family transcriptional regulator
LFLRLRSRPPGFQRVNITVPEDVLAAIDRYAEEHGFNRSGFMVQAAKKMMEAA